MPRARVRSEEELNWEREEASAGRMSRPSAPPIFFGKSGANGEEAARPSAAKNEPAPAIPADKTGCGHCGALSPKSYRFCISCGAVLKKTVAKSPLPAAAVPTEGRASEAPRPAPAPRTPVPAKPQELPPPSRKPPPPRSKPAPRVGDDLEEVAPVEIECPNCGGDCRLGEVFCKHCGTPLNKPAPAVEEARKRQVADIPEPPVELTHKVTDGEPFPLADSAVKGRAQERVQRPAAPPQEVTGKLVVIVEDGSEGRALELRGRQVDIGSQDGDIVLAEDRYLSPRHARFFRQEGNWYLRDLDSVNGVYRRLRKPTALRDGDLVLLGLEVLEFDLVDHAERGLGHAIQHGVLVFGSPATTRRARLCQQTVEGVTRDVYHLVSDETTIGRETGDIVFTSDPFMSRRHAMITWDDEAQQYVLSDLNSSNGTYLAIVDDVRLEDGDFIRLGQHLFRVDLPRKAR
jgi:pSer/pThr/pTyr-binding forkhead associated (FHA) protein